MRELTESSQRSTEPFPHAVERAVERAHRPLTWLWGRGFRFLFALDAIGLYAAMVAINLVRFGTDWPTYPASHYFVGFALATTIHLAVGYFAGLYEREPRLGVRPWLPRVVVAMSIGVAFEALAFVLTDRYLMPRWNLAILGFVGSMVLVANRSISRYLASRRQGPSRVLLVGSDDAIALAGKHFADSERDAVIVGTASETRGLFDLVNRHGASDVLLLDLAAFESAFPEPLTALDGEGVGVHQRVSAHETLLGLRSVRQIAGLPFTRMRTHALASHQLRLKRTIDLLLLAVTAPVSVPLVGALALYVRLRAGSPVLYHQTRVGKDGRHFRVVKFRTMRPDAEADGAQLSTGKSDPRVVPGLAWMRSTRADELPQLWNVLRGEMSLVGPRPERPELTERFERIVPGYGRRNVVPPGLTGLAQVHGRYETDAAYKLGYDLQYLVNWSMVLDLQIIARTVFVVLARRV